MLQGTWECRSLFNLVILFTLDMYPEVVLPTHMVVLFSFNFSGTTILFSIVAAPIYIPTNSGARIPFSHILSSTYVLCVCVCFIHVSHSDRCEVIPHCGFDLNFSGNWWCWASFHMPVDPLYVFFGKMPIQVSYSLFNQIVGFFAGLSCMNCLCILDIIPSLVILFRDIFSHLVGCLPFC